MQCMIRENTLIKLTLHDETKKIAHDSQIDRAKENFKLSPTTKGVFSSFAIILTKPYQKRCFSLFLPLF